MSAGFKVNPGANPTTVALTSGGAAVALFFDPGAAVSAGTPVAANPTTFYVAQPGSYALSLKVGGTEWATPTNQPRPVALGEGGLPTFAPAAPGATGDATWVRVV